MKQNRLLTITALVIAVLVILLAGRCRKSVDHSTEADYGYPEKATEAAPKSEATIEEEDTFAETEPDITAITEQTQTASEEKDAFLVAENLTPEEALSVSFHGQIQHVLDDLYSSVGEVEQKVAGLSDEEVLANADEYRAVILYVKDKLPTLTQSLEQLPPLDLAGQKGQVIQAQLTEAKEQLIVLKERYEIYLDRLSQMGVNMREYGL